MPTPMVLASVAGRLLRARTSAEKLRTASRLPANGDRMLLAASAAALAAAWSGVASSEAMAAGAPRHGLCSAATQASAALPDSSRAH